MYGKEEKRRVKRRNEVIQNHKQMALSDVVFTVVILLFIYLIFVPFGIGSIYMAIAESNGFIALILLFSVFALISFASCIIPTVFLCKDLGQNLVILTDRYTLELDRVELLELKTEVEWVAVRKSNRIARGRCIYASFGVLSLARLVSCFAKSHQNPSKMHSLSGASSFDAADFFEPKSFSRRAYRQYVQGER